MRRRSAWPMPHPARRPSTAPLYIHAAVGLGKTHLLQATAHAVTEAGRRVIYLTAERFMYGFVAALKGADLDRVQGEAARRSTC